MRRLHVIEDYDRMGGEIFYREEKYRHDPELLEAYHCGKKDGWREAMKEAERGGYNERRDWREMPPMYRDHERPMHDDDDEIEYRRHRNSMGRFSRY